MYNLPYLLAREGHRPPHSDKFRDFENRAILCKSIFRSLLKWTPCSDQRFFKNSSLMFKQRLLFGKGCPKVLQKWVKFENGFQNTFVKRCLSMMLFKIMSWQQCGIVKWSVSKSTFMRFPTQQQPHHKSKVDRLCLVKKRKRSRNIWIVYVFPCDIKQTY